MYAVITGDIIESQQTATTVWMPILKEVLSQFGSNPKDWEIFRGDSFQIICPPEQALLCAMIIKSYLKSHEIQVRMAIGIGTIDYRTDKVTDSNGSAFVHSGTRFDNLKKQTLALQTPWEELNSPLSIMLDLAAITLDKWTAKTAEVICFKLQNPSLSQKEIAENLDKKRQGNVSEALKRGGFDELQQLLDYYHKQVTMLC
ncbi:transcriptional regulator [Flavobacterium faecale]|uniref:Transcriptional regulator n=1 Tax=Flavobacterium faecale TaxID=1355330 RepID=A0A2S1LFG9_9FLAO|nr:transcriptional regulator [Flavobacterium faecale]AWG22505.1 transcriptional regulator [Flavobacterium faecale]